MNLDKQMKKSIIGLVFISILLFFGVQNVSKIWKAIGLVFSLFFPFLLGGAIAFILNVPMKKIESLLFPNSRKWDKWRRVVAYFITLVLVIAIIILALFVVVPELIGTINSLIEQVPMAIDSLQKLTEEFMVYMPAMQDITSEFSLDWDNIAKNAVTVIQNMATSFLSSTFGIVTQVISGIATFFIAFVFSIYILFQKENLTRQIKKLFYAVLSRRAADKVVYVGKLSYTTFSNFLSGQCVEAVILGSMFFVTMSILRMPYAILVGILIAIMALIPIFGAFIGLAVGFFLIVMVNPIQALGFVVLFIVLQQIEGNLIYPYVVGGTVGLPSIWVLFAVTIGGKMMGITGMLIFIPLCSVCYSLLREFVRKRIKERQIPNEYFVTVHAKEIPKPKEKANVEE